MRFCISILLTILLSSGSLAQDFQGRKPVNLKNGVNTVDFVGDGKEGLVIYAHRENFNAHSFEIATLYTKIDSALNVVPIFDGDKEKFEVMVSGGADCLLSDFRLIPAMKGNPSILIMANREFGDNFSSEEVVTFSYYGIKKNPEGTPGFPNAYFEKEKSFKSAKKYCDVSEAFNRELGI